MSEEQVTAPPTTGPETEVNTTGQNVDELPEWARKAIKDANDEAAARRVQLRELTEKYKDAKTPDEIAAIQNELTETNKRLERELLVLNVGKDLPDELRAVLKGETEEELRAHAEVLKKFAPAKEIDVEKLGGGLNPNDQGDDFDVKKMATLVRQGKL